jgi:hypothetical protein
MRFEVRKDDLRTTRIASRALPVPDDGEILVRVERFALTANNITYGIVGERIGYWNFFPADDGWGVIPVWGFGEVVESRHPAIALGERLYGYYPMATHLLMNAGKVTDERLVDAMPHRASLPAVYNSYARAAGEPRYDQTMDDERILLFPLYATSFCLADLLQENGFYDASQLIITSASSKTAIGLAYAIKAHAAAPSSTGLTSASNMPKVEHLELYDTVLTYERLTDIDPAVPSIIVDLSGNGSVLSRLHSHLGEQMRFTSMVGITHYEAFEKGPGFNAARSRMFFAPGHIEQRHKDWGPGVFEKKAFEFWQDAAKRSRDWLTIEHVHGIDAVAESYARVLEGRASPDTGIVVITGH